MCICKSFGGSASLTPHSRDGISDSVETRRYRIAAPLFRFWFRFVYDNQDRLRIPGEKAYDEFVKPEITDYVSPLFERLCQHALPQLINRRFINVGQWWFKQHELDVVGLSEEGLVVGKVSSRLHQ